MPVRCMLIVDNELSFRERSFAALPRVGELILYKEKGTVDLFRVVSVKHFVSDIPEDLGGVDAELHVTRKVD